MQDWLTATAADLGRGIASGRIDPINLVETYLDAIAAHPLRDRIYARTTRERALAEAQAARDRARTGLRRSPLDGVPVSWKDLFDSAGTVTEAGSALLANRMPDRDARVLQNATAMGTVCLGKTHMSELAFSGLGYNPVTATPPNVHSPDAVPGGSSSGAAASVAFGLAPLAIGSDTGGSVRVPAAWNDLVGLKTTSGRVSLDGVVPLCPSFDTVGPLARSVEDAALALAALEGTNPADLRGASLSGARLAILNTLALDDLRPDPAAAFGDALDRLARGGARIDSVEVPQVVEAMRLDGPLYNAEAYGIWRDVIEAAPDKMYPQILGRFRIGRDYSGPDVVAAWEKLRAIRARWADATATYDAVICPTTANLPPNLDRLNSDDAYYVAENLAALRNTRIGNLMGVCALTLPAGRPGCGLMLMAAPGREEALLRLGAAAEQALAA
ncbi:MAG: amidase [Marinibacterium sp.]